MKFVFIFVALVCANLHFCQAGNTSANQVSWINSWAPTRHSGSFRRVYICSDSRANRLRNSDLVAKNASTVFFGKMPVQNFVTDWKTNFFVFKGANMAVVKTATKGQLAFSKNQQQPANSGNKMPFPKIFYNLNFQRTRHPNLTYQRM